MANGIVKVDRVVSLEANEDHTGKEGYAVKMSSGKAALQTSDTAVDTIGVIIDGGEAGKQSSIALVGFAGIVDVKLHSTAGTITAGVTRIGTHTNGTWKATASTKNYGALALETGANNAVIQALLFDTQGVTA